MFGANAVLCACCALNCGYEVRALAVHTRHRDLKVGAAVGKLGVAHAYEALEGQIMSAERRHVRVYICNMRHTYRSLMCSGGWV